MAQSDTSTLGEGLQFDRAVTDSGAAAVPPSPVVVCKGCNLTITTQYYDVNGHALCGTCRAAAAAAAQTPTGLLPLLKAAGFGAGAGVVGAAIYYAVIAFAHLEIGIVAILIGYMVGYSVRRGADGRGGVRFQVLAAILTYLAVALAYSPLAIQEAMHQKKPAPHVASAASSAGADASTPAGDNPAGGELQQPARARAGKGRLLIGVVVLLGLMVALPVLVIIGSMPSGLISAFIIFIGMRQAWKMTAAAALRVAGPYRVGAPQAAAR
jgi:hypothetical protein